MAEMLCSFLLNLAEFYCEALQVNMQALFYPLVKPIGPGFIS